MAVGAYPRHIHEGVAGRYAVLPCRWYLIRGVSPDFRLYHRYPPLRLKGTIWQSSRGLGEIIRSKLLTTTASSLQPNLCASPQIDSEDQTFVNAFVFVGIACFVIHAMMKSRTAAPFYPSGKRDSRLICGINTTYYKTRPSSCPPFSPAWAGSLYRATSSYLDPGGFGFIDRSRSLSWSFSAAWAP
jgi:hypothetical protein